MYEIQVGGETVTKVNDEKKAIRIASEINRLESDKGDNGQSVAVYSGEELIWSDGCWV